MSSIEEAQEAALKAVREIDPDKLRRMADWFDLYDQMRGLPAGEVQQELRHWADLVDIARWVAPEDPQDAPEGVVELGYGQSAIQYRSGALEPVRDFLGSCWVGTEPQTLESGETMAIIFRSDATRTNERLMIFPGGWVVRAENGRGVTFTAFSEFAFSAYQSYVERQVRTKRK